MSTSAGSDSDELTRLRLSMVAQQLRGRGIRDERVLDAMARIPRHRFVPEIRQRYAYDDRPLDIGSAQTISQPYMVAVMTEALELAGVERVLEIGTGSGYQTAVLADLAAEVLTVERHADLSERARGCLAHAGIENVRFRVGDGTLGWPEEAPFDRIIVTAGAPKVPPALTDQVADGGLLVIPVGDAWGQELLRLRRKGDRLKRERLLRCVFVKLIGQQGWPGRPEA